LHGHVLDGGDSEGDHLLKVVHLVHVLTLVPDTVGLINEDNVFILVVDHPRDVVQVHVLEEDHEGAAVEGVGRSGHGSLTTILHVHVFVIITVAVAFGVPTATILELSGDIEPVPVLGHPLERGRTSSSVHFEDIETREETEGGQDGRFPEAGPLNDSGVFINSLALGEVECWVGVHRGSLDEGLELVTGMAGSSFDSEDSLNGLFTENWVALTVSDMGEFLVLGPVDLMLGSTIVIVMGGSRSVLQSLSVVDFLGLGEPGSCWLSPSVVEFKELVVQMVLNLSLRVGDLVIPGGDVTLLIQVVRAHLSNVKVNHVGVVSVDVHQFIFSQFFHREEFFHGDVLVG